MTVRIILGNCLEVMRALEPDSVHCVVTSPAYYGLRDYGVEPSVWGGDPACRHAFDEETVTRQIRTGMGLEALGERHRGGGKKHGRIAETFEFTRGCCSLCGAWRGVFGLEPTPDMYVDHLVDIFEEVRRVLRPDGTLWLNLGDSYYSPRHPGGVGENSTINGQDTQEQLRLARRLQRGGFTGNKGYVQGNAAEPHRNSRLPGLKPKDLIGIPWMAAFALRRAGWWLRQDNVWHKPNPMPESTRDRCTKAHEYLFHLSKSEHYYFDQEAVKEDASENSNPRKAAGADVPKKTPKSVERDLGVKANDSFHAALGNLVSKRNKRSVWTIATRPFPEAHFATFPYELVEPCVLAGTSARGCCPTCAAPWERVAVSASRNVGNSGRLGTEIDGKGHVSDQIREEHDVRDGPIADVETIGWYPSCGCAALPRLPKYPRRPSVKGLDDAAREASLAAWRAECSAITEERRRLCAPAAKLPTVPAVVLDPFGGAGTTAVVCEREQRDSILIELGPNYVDMARRRIERDGGMLARVVVESQTLKEAAE